jgi:hypothetical protein
MLRVIVAIGIAIILGPISCFFSGWIEMGKDYSQEDTVGVIHRNGFPIWFRESAPGFSVTDGLHMDRLDINTAIWTLAIFVLAAFILFRKKRNRTDPSTSSG